VGPFLEGSHAWDEGNDEGLTLKLPAKRRKEDGLITSLGVEAKARGLHETAPQCFSGRERVGKSRTWGLFLPGRATRGEKTALIVGAGMVPRGEVGIVVAMIGFGMGTISSETYSVIVLVSIATTLYAPFLIKTIIKAETKKERRSTWGFRPRSRS